MTTEQPAWQLLPGENNYRVPVKAFLAETATVAGGVSIAILPALGVSVAYYEPLAQALQEAGHDAYLVEQRGHGESELRPSRNENYGFREMLGDIDVAVVHIRSQAANKPLFLLGHSLGGHLSCMYAGWRGVEYVDGVILAACGTPWIKAYDGIDAMRLRALYHLIPISRRLLGYYPGDKFGFGGREARGMMMDWRQMAGGNRYLARGMKVDFEQGIRCYPGRVLTVRMTDDEFAQSDAVAKVWQKFKQARRSHRLFDEKTLGATADHFRWARRPNAVCTAVNSWVREEAPDGAGWQPEVAP